MSSYAATPFTNEMCQEKVKRREQMKKESERLWTTVQRTEHDQMSNCCCFFVFFQSKKIKIKNCNTAPVVTVCLQHHHYHHFAVLINPTFAWNIYLFKNTLTFLFFFFFFSTFLRILKMWWVPEIFRKSNLTLSDFPWCSKPSPSVTASRLKQTLRIICK